MLKRSLSLLMCLIMFMSFNTIAFAAEPESESMPEIQPCYTLIDRTSSWIKGVNDGEVNCFSYAWGKEGIATKTGIDVYLQKKVLFWWSNTEYEWHTLAPGDYAEIRAYNYKLPSKGTYRVKSVVTVYSGNQKETDTIYTSQYTYAG